MRWMPGVLVAAALSGAWAWPALTGPDAPRPSVSTNNAGFDQAPDPTAPAPNLTPIPASPSPDPTAKVPSSGNGSFELAEGDSGLEGRGHVVDYRVEVEADLPISPAEFAETVDDTLADKRGWTARGFAFRRGPDAPLRVVLATPSTTDRLCAPLRTQGEVSCRNGNDVVINARRWVEGAGSYGDDVKAYRRYVVNHEVGHSLGFGHQPCPRADVKAPVMLQQTLGLQGCKANPWP